MRQGAHTPRTICGGERAERRARNKNGKTMLKHSDSLNAGVRGGSELKQFEECLSRARNCPKMNHWSCEDVWSSKELRERGACTGWDCEYYPSEPREESGRQSGYVETQIEQEALTYLLSNPESISEGLRVGLLSEGFIDEYRCRDCTCVSLNRALWHVCRYLAYHGRPIRCTAILASLSRSPKLRPLVDEIEQYLQRLQGLPYGGPKNSFVKLQLPWRRARFHLTSS